MRRLASQPKRRLPTRGVGQAAAGGFELFAIRFVAALFDAILAHRFGMALLPHVGQ